MDTTTHARPGDVLLGKYEVLRVLGQGGMGLVVAVRHVELNELFAIKFLVPGVVPTGDTIGRFVREARASASLRSQHVAKVHDVGRLDNGMPYMVMEYLEGADLEAIVQTGGPLAVEDATTLVLQACEALAEAHARGIVHRDIKPSNLFLTRKHDGRPCVKLLDFGISKQMNVGNTAITKSGMILGSPLYMSPEQLDDSRSVDRRSDIWALGVVLYALTTGQTPFVGDNIGRLMIAIFDHAPKPPSQVKSDLPGALDEIVLRCLEKRPEDRYQSVEELASALRSLLDARSTRVLLGAGGMPETPPSTMMKTLDALALERTLPAPELAPLLPVAEGATPSISRSDTLVGPAKPKDGEVPSTTKSAMSRTLERPHRRPVVVGAVVVGLSAIAAFGVLSFRTPRTPASSALEAASSNAAVSEAALAPTTSALPPPSPSVTLAAAEPAASAHDPAPSPSATGAIAKPPSPALRTKSAPPAGSTTKKRRTVSMY